MKRSSALMVMGLCTVYLAAPEVTFGQLRGSIGGGVRGGIGGIRGGSASPRSGRSFQNNPIANPAPSLTPHQVFNPRGSLSPGQVRNPAPSLSRPRSGVSPSPINRNYRTPGTYYQSVGKRPERTTNSNRAAASYAARKNGQKLTSIQRQLKLASTVSEQKQLKLQLRVAQLINDFETYPNGERWVRYLDLSAVESYLARRKDKKNSDPTLEKVMARFKKVGSDSKYERVSSLQAFRNAQSALGSLIDEVSSDASDASSSETSPKPLKTE
jgi:hypothetical protein